MSARAARPLLFGLCAALLALLAGDFSGFSATPVGVDPLQVLDLQVKPNVIIVLDSSGSMGEVVTSTGLVTGVANGELVGDDPNAKMRQAKEVLKKVVQNNANKVSFQFGRYTQVPAAEIKVALNDRFYYRSTDAGAASLSINSSGNGASAPGIKRALTDNVTVGGTTYYYALAGKFWNGQSINAVSKLVSSGTATSPASFTLTNSDGSVKAKFELVGVNWRNTGDADTYCNGYQSLVPLQPCTATTGQVTAITPYLEPEVEYESNGSIKGYQDGTLGSAPTSEPTLVTGIRPLGGTPIVNSLYNVRTSHWVPLWNGTISAQDPKQRTFVIFVTDGDDQCGLSSPTADALDQKALAAAYQAELLYKRLDSTQPASSVQTFFVAFGGAAGVQRSNWIAWGGSGMTKTNDGTKWTAKPTAADRAACSTCVDAFSAANATALEAALQSAIDQGVSSGTFSDQESVTESVYELGGSVSPQPSPPVSPLDPDTRYNASVPVLLQSTFSMPNFEGHLKAFRNDGTTTSEVWDAGSKLLQRVATNGINAVCPTRTVGGSSLKACTFAELHAGADPTNVATASSVAIRRRIYTTTRNGVFPSSGATVTNLTTASYTPAEQVPLWPPTTGTSGVAPSGNSNPDGSLDGPLGLTALSFTQLQAQFKACVGSNLPSDCTSTSKQLAVARREAREMILAYTAGAKVVDDGTGSPARDVLTKAVLYNARTWVLADATLSVPAVVAPPLDAKPTIHTAEYAFFRDGIRNTANKAVNGISRGFGLRNPDKDGQATSEADQALKPVMSVVYHGANDMLHAFRAGPCPSGVTACSGETGGEELWGFVPYDLLGKLSALMNAPTRDNHDYMLAAPLRFGDVFVPGNFSLNIGGTTVKGAGVWRVLLFAGRGPGGKMMTALDVTVPGPFTVAALKTAPPIALWNRGNPDTQDGQPKTTNSFNNTFSTAAGQGDYDRLLKLGQTWSTPALGRATPENNTTPRKPTGVEFTLWMGSGFGEPAEGSAFYALDPTTGDVISSADVGDRNDGTQLFTENVLLAPPAAYNKQQLTAGFTGHPASGKVTRLYIGDVQGRLWKFLADSAADPILFKDLGATQPLGNAAALLAFNSDATVEKPHVYLEAGNDNRVTPPPAATPPFLMLALRDEASDTDKTSPQNPTVLFSKTFPNGTPGYRGTAQPATAYNTEKNPRVFFLGTRFNPALTSCVSSFDSVLFALKGVSGNAAYDLTDTDADESLTLTGKRATSVRISGGRIQIDQSIGGAPPPPAPATVGSATTTAQSDVYLLTNYRSYAGFGPSSVCK